MRALALGAVMMSACGAAQAPRAHDDACETCLAHGGTWQPGQCTTDCAYADASCYRDRCPPPCSASACDACESGSACASAGCAWHVESEAMWCTASR